MRYNTRSHTTRRRERYHLTVSAWGCAWVGSALLAAGLLQAAPEHHNHAAAVRSQSSQKIWNLRQADILSVIDEVSQETGKNFIVDPRVKGQISIVSSTGLETDALYQVFLSALHVLGYTAIETPNAVRIVPDTQARAYPGKVSQSDRPVTGDETVVQVVPVHQLSAQALVPVLRNLVAQQGHLAAYAPGNALIIADLASNVQRLVQVIKAIEASQSDSIEWIRLQHNQASVVAETLRQLLASHMRGADAQGTVISADERNNALLIAGDAARRAKFRAIVKELDTPEAATDHTEVLYLKYQRAEDMVPVVHSVLESERMAGSSSATGSTHTPAGGWGSSIAGAAATLSGRSRAASDLPAEQIAAHALPRAGTGMPGIYAEPHTNALVVSGNAHAVRTVRRVLEKLDIRRKQVLVEAAIVEVSADTFREWGMQWMHGKRVGVQGGMAFRQNSGPALALNSMLTAEGASLNAPADSVWGTGAGLAIGFIKNGNLRSLVAALSSDQHTNVLSTPSLVALDNQKSQLIVGQQIPFKNGSYASTSDAKSPTPFNTIEYRDVALSLEIVPQITQGRAVQLALDQQVNQLLSSTGDQPITSKRQIKTSVLVNDGDVLVLGGLMETKDTLSWQRIPILGDIPFVGSLFGHRVSTRQKTNLMVFIKPTILSDSAESQQVTGSKYHDLLYRARLDGVQLPALRTGMRPVELPLPF